MLPRQISDKLGSSGNAKEEIMFQKSESPDIWQSWLQQTSPCACCAPIISRLNGFMAIR
ncbi:MAG: hypothetical protein ACI9B8_001274, partial [Sulfitobacter sp.]